MVLLNSNEIPKPWHIGQCLYDITHALEIATVNINVCLNTYKAETTARNPFELFFPFYNFRIFSLSCPFIFETSLNDFQECDIAQASNGDDHLYRVPQSDLLLRCHAAPLALSLRLINFHDI